MRAFPAVRPRGRLTRFEKERAIDRVYNAMIDEGETQLKRLAEIAGVTARRVHPIVAAARSRMAIETNEPPEAVRTKLVGRYDKLYRESLTAFKACIEKKDFKNASGFLATANAIVANEGKVRGVEALPAQGAAAFRLTLEGTGIPPALVERLVRLQAQSGTGTILELEGEVPRDGDRGTVRQDDVAPVRVAPHGGDAPGDP